MYTAQCARESVWKGIYVHWLSERASERARESRRREEQAKSRLEGQAFKCRGGFPIVDCTASAAVAVGDVIPGKEGSWYN